THLLFAPAAPPRVEVCQPISREVTDYEQFDGRIAPASSVDVRSRVSGYLDQVLVKEGDVVKQGDLLFRIDARPFELEFDKANAILKSAQARLNRAHEEYERAKEVSKTPSAISQQELSRIGTDLEDAKSALQSAQATAVSAQL